MLPSFSWDQLKYLMRFYFCWQFIFGGIVPHFFLEGYFPRGLTSALCGALRGVVYFMTPGAMSVVGPGGCNRILGPFGLLGRLEDWNF